MEGGVSAAVDFVSSSAIGVLEVVASSLQSSTVSTIIPMPAGVSISSSMEQIIALKPEAVMPTTCSTQVLASDINSRSAKLNPSTEAGRHVELVCQHQMATGSTHSPPPWPAPNAGMFNTTFLTRRSITSKDGAHAEATSLNQSLTIPVSARALMSPIV
jgi:hypothetical protein